MLGTTAAVRKIIQDDGKSRLSYHRQNNGLLLSLSESRVLPLANDPIISVLRAYSTGPRTTTSRKDESSSESLVFSSRLPLSSLAGRRGYSFGTLNHSDSSILLQPTTIHLSSHQLSRNRRNGSHHWESKIRFNPQYESRVFLSSATPSSENKSETKRKIPRKATIPIPKSAPAAKGPLASIDVSAIAKGTYDMTLWLTKATFRFIIHLPGNTIFFLTHAKERREKIADMKEFIKKEVDHYWVGFKVSSYVRRGLQILKSCNWNRRFCGDWKVDMWYHSRLTFFRGSLFLRQQ